MRGLRVGTSHMGSGWGGWNGGTGESVTADRGVTNDPALGSSLNVDIEPLQGAQDIAFPV